MAWKGRDELRINGDGVGIGRDGFDMTGNEIEASTCSEGLDTEF